MEASERQRRISGFLEVKEACYDYSRGYHFVRWRCPGVTTAALRIDSGHTANSASTSSKPSAFADPVDVADLSASTKRQQRLFDWN